MTDLQQGYTPSDILDSMNSLIYIIKSQIENTVNTIDVVRVINVNIELGTIDVMPVVKEVSPSKIPIPESPIFGVRYMKYQVGTNLIDMTPEIGDIGLLLVCKKDLSALALGIVGSNMKYDTSNGIYIGGLFGMNLPATQFIKFSTNDITITGTGTINVTAPTANVNATTTNINSTDINLGGEGGVGIAKIGSKVTNNGQPDGATVGFIAEGSTITKSL